MESQGQLAKSLLIAERLPCAVSGEFIGKEFDGEEIIRSPIDNQVVSSFCSCDETSLDTVVESSLRAYEKWRRVPPPVRGEVIRRFGESLREHKSRLSSIITLEVGKPISESEGEVQELIDICDFAVGLSRQLYGRTIASERVDHSMGEQWHPLGTVGIITAFNFPLAVWGWNAIIALVCGNAVVWKPSEKASVSATCCFKVLRKVISEFEEVPKEIASIVLGGEWVGDLISKSKGIALVSATGSTKMGRSVGSNVARRLGRSILELGGNNAAIVAPSAPIDLALDSIVFSAVATAGQRCTTLRRLIVHEAIYDELLEKLVKKYASLTIGDPFDPTNLVGPLVSYEAVELYKDTLKEAERSGARVLCSGTMKGNFVAPAIIEAHKSLDYYSVERFVPVLNVIKYSSFGEALQIHNSTRYALSSSIFTQNLLEAEKFLSSAGSDCGIVNVNIGTCGAEIGGAFGGNKDTGGGRVAGSDSWKNYMRNSTQTINYSGEMLLAQGVRFGD